MAFSIASAVAVNSRRRRRRRGFSLLRNLNNFFRFVIQRLNGSHVVAVVETAETIIDTVYLFI